jgi:DNA polymerase-3 subunit delta
MTPAEFKACLQRKKISSLIVFVGEEPFGLEEAIRLLCDTVLDDTTRDFNFQQFSSREAEIEAVVNAAHTFPVLAPKRLLVLRNIHELSSDGQNKLSEYLQNPSPETILAMTAERLDKKNPLCKLLQSRAEWVEFKKLREYQLPDLVRGKAGEKGYRFSREALDLFCHRCGTDLRRLNGEMEKLLEFLGEKKNIEVEDVAVSSSEGGEPSIFELLNAVGRRNLPETISCLQEQLEERAAPPFILAMLARHFRQLWIIRSLRKQGLDKDAIAGKAGLNSYFLGSMLGQAENYRTGEFRKIFELLLETDKTLKTSGGSPGSVLESLLLDIVNRSN